LFTRFLFWKMPEFEWCGGVSMASHPRLLFQGDLPCLFVICLYVFKTFNNSMDFAKSALL